MLYKSFPNTTCRFSRLIYRSIVHPSWRTPSRKKKRKRKRASLFAEILQASPFTFLRQTCASTTRALQWIVSFVLSVCYYSSLLFVALLLISFHPLLTNYVCFVCLSPSVSLFSMSILSLSLTHTHSVLLSFFFHWLFACAHLRNGWCARGDNCRFSHEGIDRSIRLTYACIPLWAPRAMLPCALLLPSPIYFLNKYSSWLSGPSGISKPCILCGVRGHLSTDCPKLGDVIALITSIIASYYLMSSLLTTYIWLNIGVWLIIFSEICSYALLLHALLRTLFRALFLQPLIVNYGRIFWLSAEDAEPSPADAPAPKRARVRQSEEMACSLLSRSHTAHAYIIYMCVFRYLMISQLHLQRMLPRIPLLPRHWLPSGQQVLCLERLREHLRGLEEESSNF